MQSITQKYPDTLANASEYAVSTVLFRRAVAERLGIHPTDMDCLSILFHQKIATAGELAASIGLSSGATTAMLKRLEQKALITRRQNASDKRITYVQITSIALAKTKPLYSKLKQAEQSVVAQYSSKDAAIIADFLKKLATAWQAERTKIQ